MIWENLKRDELESVLTGLANIHTQIIAMQEIIERMRSDHAYDNLPTEKRPKWVLYGMTLILDEYLQIVRNNTLHLIEGEGDCSGLAGRTDVVQLPKEKDVSIKADSRTGNKETAKR